MIEIDNLHKYFGPFVAVNGVSFNVNKGEVLGFLGPNGAGKSTTMKMITGFLTPTKGKIHLAGLDITQNALVVKRKMGYLPEGAPAYPDMTPHDFLHFIAEVRGFRGTEKAKRVHQTLERVNLFGVAHQPIDTLSKGFKRRVGLAQAILHDPEILIMDEPTDGLDPNQKHEVRSLIKDMAHDKVIILSTHILEEVHAVCSRAIIIAQGKLVADGTPADLEARSALHNAVTVTLNASLGTASTIRKDLLAVSGVRKIDPLRESEGALRYRLYPKAGANIISAVSQQVRDKQWNVSELHVEQGQLDDVFRDITT